MMLAIYVCKVIACSAILFSYYYFFLRNKQLHQYNRYYLLTCTVLSFIFPLLRIPVFHAGNPSGSSFIQTLSVISTDNWENAIVLTAHKNSSHSFLTAQNAAIAVYMTGLIICSYLLLRSLMYIRKITRMYTNEKLDSVTVYNTCEPGTPFSFFHSLFWNEKIILNSEKGQQILCHELFHIRAGHSYDIMFMKGITALFWFNPFFHLIAREIKAIHEFLADEYASSSVNRYDYAELLVTEAINNKTSLVSNQFFHHQIKRRIAMLIQQHPSNFSYMRRMMALPLLFILFCAFTLKSGRYNSIGNFFSRTSGNITIVIDPAHGGIDPGARGLNDLNEKDITLSIAQKIKELSTDYGVTVILTRDKDILPENAANSMEGNRNRIKILEQSKGDVFVSIHVNSSGSVILPGPTHGFDIYVSDQNKQYERSKLLGSAITGEIKNTYKISEILKERKSQSIYVLAKSNAPAVLIECGYLTSKTDIDFITNTQNQEKIANDILKGIVKYQQHVSVAHRTDDPEANKADTIPAEEFVRLMEIHQTEDKASEMFLRADTGTDVMVVKYKKGDSILTRLSEVKYLAEKHMGTHFPVKNDAADQNETAAQFPGGVDGWWRYLSKNFHYPMEAQKYEIQGTVILEFMIGKDGNINKVKALSGPKKGGLREEAIRLIQNSGPWIPPVQNGHPVASVKKQPVIFRLDTE